MDKSLILCDCSGTNHLNSKDLSEVTGLACSQVHTAMCTSQIDSAAKAVTDGKAILCCTQEWRTFQALADELEVPMPPLLDLRDRAGWSADKASKLPKMSALVAEALVPRPAQKTMDVASEGVCLILSNDATEMGVAEQLSEYLSVTLLVPNPTDDMPSRNYDIIAGNLRRATGTLGNFEVTIDALQQLDPAGHGTHEWSVSRQGGQSHCDIILDLRGGTPLFPAHEKRDGYLWVDASHAPSVAKAILNASHMVGTFEKTLFVKTEPSLCAHSRAQKSACSNCLDICPTGAITSAGDFVEIDPAICAGCGACAALCPSGSITYEADPSNTTLRRIQALMDGYNKVAGDHPQPRLLVHDAHGRDMIAMAARFGDGLAANMLPIEIEAISSFGHAEALGALASGFGDVHILLSSTADQVAIGREVALATAIAGEHIHIIDTPDPDQMTAALSESKLNIIVETPILAMGSRRQVTRSAARALHGDDKILSLPEDAPYGAVLVDTDSCSMCLSCVSLCPSGALGENPDKPQLLFQEDACLQCGLCSNICPENAITYEPRLNLGTQALEQTVLNEEEPFACIECGVLFGVKSSIERITEKLSSGVGAFADPDALKLVQMCGDCRVNAQFHSTDNPFAAQERPRVRTTADYYSDRDDH